MLNEETLKSLTSLNRRLGYADPATCKFLFIGIEEGGGPYELDDFSLDTRPLELWAGTISKARKQWSPIYTIMSKIISQVENIPDLERYQITQMCHDGDVTGLMNLFPLPKKSLDAWPYKKLTYEQYLSWFLDAKRERYAAICLELSKMPNLKATICFGKTKWPDFINCLSLSGEEHMDKGGIRIYPNRRIVLSPFFQYRFGTINEENLPRIVDAIKSVLSDRERSGRPNLPTIDTI